MWRTFRLAAESQKRNLDIFHGLSHELPVGIERTRVKTVLTMHDLIFLQFPELYPAIDRFFYKKKYLGSCARADKIIAVSEQTRRDLVELAHVPEEKIVVVYQGCHPMFLRKTSSDERASVQKKYGLPSEYMLSVGALEPRKNHILILKAMAAAEIDFPLVIVGADNGCGDSLKAFAASHHLDNKVVFVTKKDFADFPAIYQGATLFLYPSFFEGFGIPIVEALQSGVPVIAATGSCLEESGGPFSRYVAPDNVEETASTMKELLSNEELRKEMVAKSAEHILQFSDEVIAQKLMKIYREVL